MAKKTREEVVQELQPFEGKYKKKSHAVMDLNTRLKLALKDGMDPLGYMTIAELVKDIEIMNKLNPSLWEEGE